MPGNQTTTQQQQSQTQPWAPAQPLLNGILGQLQGSLPNTGITGNQTGALNQIENNAAGTSQFNPAISSVTSNLLAGGGALNQAPQLQSAYDQFKAQTSPLASNTNYDPMQTPGIGDELQALKDNITSSVNGSFAAAGRDGSGYNQKALASGLAAGLAPVLTSQYNQNVQNQQSAAGNLYNAGNTTSGALTGLQQQSNANQAAGINSVGAGLQAQNSGPMATLAAEAERFGIPTQNLGLLANIGIPIAGLGSQSSGTSTSNTSTPWYSGLSAVGGLFSGGQNSAFNGMAGAAGGIANGIGGLLSFL